MITNDIPKLLMMTVCLSSATLGFSERQNPPQTSVQKNGKGILKTLGKISDRKRTPSKFVIEVYYECGQLSLHSETCEGNFILELVNVVSNDTFYIYNISVGEVTYIELDCSEYNVIATNSYGSIYEGELIIE